MSGYIYPSALDVQARPFRAWYLDMGNRNERRATGRTRERRRSKNRAVGISFVNNRAERLRYTSSKQLV